MDLTYWFWCDVTIEPLTSENCSVIISENKILFQESNWKYPSSFERRYGSLSVPSTSEDALAKHQFPENVSFRHENYVLDSDEKLEKVTG